MSILFGPALAGLATVTTGPWGGRLHAAEPVPAGPHKPWVELVQPDLSKPVWVVIQCDKVAFHP